MTRSDAEAEMLQGYWSGLKGEPEPGDNRSYSFKHGWRNGRDDRAQNPRSPASYIHSEALDAIKADLNAYNF
jgi:ribosome modulation factor